MRTNFVEVIDDFLSPSYFKHLSENVFGDDNFPWYYSDDASYPDRNRYSINGLEKNNSFGFNVSIFYDGKFNNNCSKEVTSSVYPFALMVKDKLRASSILRIRADLTVWNPTNLMHGPHVDYEGFHYSSVFYLNETDGNTVIFNEKVPNRKGISHVDDFSLTIKESIEPKPNRLILFDGTYIHTGHSPSKYQCRKLLNSNYK
jgi:hypothetical protein